MSLQPYPVYPGDGFHNPIRQYQAKDTSYKVPRALSSRYYNRTNNRPPNNAGVIKALNIQKGVPSWTSVYGQGHNVKPVKMGGSKTKQIIKSGQNYVVITRSNKSKMLQ